MALVALAACASPTAFDRGLTHLRGGRYAQAQADFDETLGTSAAALPVRARPGATPPGPPPPSALPAAPVVLAPPPEPAVPALDSQALGSRALTRELQGDHAGALEDLRAAIAQETDPTRVVGLENLLLLLESSRDRRDSDVRGDPPR